MSKLTSLVLGVVGAVIGFVVSGFNPMGAWVGFGIGYGLGTIIDPITPDMPSPGEPMGELEIMTSIEGIPFPDILGTTKFTGNLLFYGNNYREEVTEEQEGGGSGGGDSEDVVVGYRYYLSWAMGMCLGPVDNLYTIWRDDEVVWAGNLPISEASNGEVTVGLYSGDRGQWAVGTYEDEYGKWVGGAGDFGEDENFFGLCTFYFGTTTQTPNAQLGALMLDEGAFESTDYNIPYRRQCWAYFHDNYIGDYNRCPTMKFVVRKAPECSFDT